MASKYGDTIVKGGTTVFSEVTFKCERPERAASETVPTPPAKFADIKHLFSDKPLRFSRKRLQ